MSDWGRRRAVAYDIAVDPLEGTKLCAGGLPGALATIAFAESGTLAALSASFYMDKLIGATGAPGVLDITAEPEVNLTRAAEALAAATLPRCEWLCSTSRVTSS